MCGGGLYAVKQWAARPGEAVMAPARLESRAPLTRSGIVPKNLFQTRSDADILSAMSGAAQASLTLRSVFILALSLFHLAHPGQALVWQVLSLFR